MTDDNKSNNKKFGTLIFSVFILSVIYALIDSSTNYCSGSGSDLVKFAETILRNIIKNFGTIGLIVLIFMSENKK